MPTHDGEMRQPVVTIIGMGDMGAWVARRLTAQGAEVRSVLSGRSRSSAERAASAGVRLMPDDRSAVAGADFIFSIVPPAAAPDLAARLAPSLAAMSRKPVYVDCNAIGSRTVIDIARVILDAGCPFIDVGIFGSAPKDGSGGPRFYASGDIAPQLQALSAHGLDIRILDAPIGAASTLKCCFAGLGKGLIALGVAGALTARGAGGEAALAAELRGAMPPLANLLTRLIPESYEKSYRWVAEMTEIGAECAAVPGAGTLFEGASQLFAELARAKAEGPSGDGPIDHLEQFVRRLA